MSLDHFVAMMIALIPIIVAVIQPIIGALQRNVVVCSTCIPELISAKTRGIEEAMQRLIMLIGDETFPLNPTVSPITFHLDGDYYCGPYQSAMTGNFTRDATGLGHVCLWDVEKENRSRRFTVENAKKIEDQLLPVHEAMHGWFVGRQENYLIQEPFCKLMSFIISEFPGGPEYCNWFKSTPANHPDILMKYLCEIGMTSQSAVQILRLTAQSASEKNRALTDAEFAELVNFVLGKDAIPAFRKAGILQ